MRYVFSLSGAVSRVLAYDLPLDNVIGADDSNSHQFFTHEATFDSARSSWSQCRAALKYRAHFGADFTTRTLLMQNSTSSKYELQDAYATELPKRNDEITAANTHVRMITTNADTNNPPAGILKLDLRLVTNYTRPFTIFGLRENSPDSDSRPSILYVTESSAPKLVVKNNRVTHTLACTLPASCRIIYRYTGGSDGELTVLDSTGTEVATNTHSLSNFGNATSTPSYTTTANGVAIFHYCVTRAELVVSPTSRSFTNAEQAALITWAQTNSA
jgi:hypothetical protein